MKKDFLYVLAQFLLFAVYFIDCNILPFTLTSWLRYSFIGLTVIGVVIILFGIINLDKNLTALPSPKRNANLVTIGIYGYIRHPIYSGILLTLFAYSFYGGSGFRTVISLILLVVFYYKSEYEEQQLIKLFKHYSEYKKGTGRFFPKFLNKS